jgi:hypothetical protein
MRLERHENGAEPECLAAGDQTIENVAMTAVHSIECPHRDHGGVDVGREP